MEESKVIPIRMIMEALGFRWNDGEYIHTTRKTVVSEAYALDYMRDLIWDGEGAKVIRPSYARTAIPHFPDQPEPRPFDRIYFMWEDGTPA